MNQQGGGVSKFVVGTGVDEDMDTNDTFDIRVANLDSTSDIDIGELAGQIST